MQSEHWIGTCVVRQLILLGVIACLCFSVGEGLRLTPFPVSTLSESNVAKVRSEVIPLFMNGPVDVPTWAQKREKRQVVDYGNPQGDSHRELTACQRFLVSSYKSVPLVSSLSGSLITGRAPPFLS